MDPRIKTTVVGSYPIPEWLAAFPTEQALVDATMVVFKTQESAGIDVVADGELYRFDVNHPDTNGMIDYFVRPLESVRTGFGLTDLKRFREDAGMAFRAKPAGVVEGPIGEGRLNLVDDYRRARALTPKGIHYVDCGTSGGVWGATRGYCMMIGGEKAVVDRLDPIFAALAPGLGEIPRTPKRESRDPRAESGYIHAGPAGAGHFVKMVHNGIEYGLMQAYAEGFDILKGKSSQELPEDERFDINLPDVAEVWRRGSVISSWLLDLTAIALAKSPQLREFTGNVSDSGEGRWTVEAAIEEAVPANVLSAALYARFRSRLEHSFGEKILSAMRNEFGGHVEPKA